MIEIQKQRTTARMRDQTVNKGVKPVSNRKARVIPESKAGPRKVIAQMAPPIGDTEVNLICGSCNTMLIKGYSPAKNQNVVVRCINCGKLNSPKHAGEIKVARRHPVWQPR
jgi:hypothetical protein